MSEQITDTTQEVDIDEYHFKTKYGLSVWRLEEISAMIARHENGEQKLTTKEIIWARAKYDHYMADVLDRNSSETQKRMREQAIEKLDKLRNMDHSKRRHLMSMYGKNKYLYRDTPNPNKNQYSRHRMRETEPITNTYPDSNGKEVSYTYHKDVVLSEQPGVFTAFCHTELVNGKLEWYYKADSPAEWIYATSSTGPWYGYGYGEGRETIKHRVSIRGNDFYSFEEVIARRWFQDGVPYFQLYPEKSVESQQTGSDLWALRRVCFDYYPDTTQVIPGFLINWTQDMKRRGSEPELPKYKFQKVAHGGFSNIEYIPDQVMLGSTPQETANNVEYHVIKVNGKHFIYLMQSIEPATSVMIYIPDNLLGLMDNGKELYVALTHPPEIDVKKPYFRQGEWYFVPTDKKTSELIKPTEPPKEKGYADNDRRTRSHWYEIEVDSSHVVGEYRFDEQGNSYVRGTVYHMESDHEPLRLGSQTWFQIFRSDAKGHSADMRGATVRYD
jgi:hypothetical protein